MPGLTINRLRVQIRAAVLPSATLGKLFTHTMCLCHQPELIGISWEGLWRRTGQAVTDNTGISRYGLTAVVNVVM